MKAIWNDEVIAESDKTIEVEGNHYFPPASIKEEYFKESKTHSVCEWKGVAKYYHIVVKGETNKMAAWYYPEPSKEAENLKGYVAFWREVEIIEYKKKRMKAIWNETVIAESDDTIVVEGNHYFPPSSINKKYFKESETHSTCPWKGLASYYSLDVNGKENADAAWYYPSASELAKNIEGYVAFWKGVSVEN